MAALVALLVLMDRAYIVISESQDCWAAHSCCSSTECSRILNDSVPDETLMLLQTDLHVRSIRQDSSSHANRHFHMAIVAFIVVLCGLCAVACLGNYMPSKETENERKFAVTPSIATLAVNLGDHPPVKKGTEKDFLTVVDQKNRQFLGKLSSEYMATLSGDGEPGGGAWSWMTTNPYRNLKYSKELIASVEAADRLLKWSIANPKFSMMINAHRYMVQNVIDAPGKARLSDKATVELLWVFALMTLSVAPLSGNLDLKKGSRVFAESKLDCKTKSLILRGRERLLKGYSLLAKTSSPEDKQSDSLPANTSSPEDEQSDSESDEEENDSHENNASTSREALESGNVGIDDRLPSTSPSHPSILEIDPVWFTDDIADHARFVLEVSQHLKSVDPSGKGEWLESRTMCFYTSFLTDVVATLRMRMHDAQAMQAKLIGLAATLGFTALNMVMKALADLAKSGRGF